VGKLLLVAQYEYLRFVGRRSFLLAVFSLPLVLILIVAVGELAQRSQTGPTIGYVDKAGLLDPEVTRSTDSADLRAAVIRPSSSVEAGRAALEAGEIGTLFVLPADYLQSRALQAYTGEDGLSVEARTAFGDFVSASLAARYEPPVAERLANAPDIVVRAAKGSREVTPSSVVFHFALPFAAALLFIVAGVISAGYLLQAVSDEKESRTVEILTTSVSPSELIVGKIVGLTGVVGTQLVVWIAGVIAAVLIGVQFIEALAGMEIPWLAVWVAVAFFVPAFLLLSGIMVCLGGAFPEYRQSQQLVGVVNILFLLPLFFTTLILADPNGPLAMFLSFFPTTSFVAILIRWPATSVPFWQVVLAWLSLTAAAAFSVWAAPRIFRAGMLRYGQRLTLQAAWQALRPWGR